MLRVRPSASAARWSESSVTPVRVGSSRRYTASRLVRIRLAISDGEIPLAFGWLWLSHHERSSALPAVRASPLLTADLAQHAPSLIEFGSSCATAQEARRTNAPAPARSFAAPSLQPTVFDFGTWQGNFPHKRKVKP